MSGDTTPRAQAREAFLEIVRELEEMGHSVTWEAVPERPDSLDDRAVISFSITIDGPPASGPVLVEWQYRGTEGPDDEVPIDDCAFTTFLDGGKSEGLDAFRVAIYLGVSY